MEKILDFSKRVYNLNSYEIKQVSGHDGGRNLVYSCSQNGENFRADEPHYQTLKRRRYDGQYGRKQSQGLYGKADRSHI